MCSSKRIYSIISSDASYLHTLIEELYPYHACRHLGFDEAAKLLKPRKFVLAAHGPILRRIDVTFKLAMDYEIDAILKSFGVGLALISFNQVLICGINFETDGKSSYILDFQNTSLKQTSDMITSRSLHGIVPYDGSVYVFGGSTTNIASLASSEVYKVCTEEWTGLPDMPGECYNACATEVGGKVFITGNEIAGVYRYDIEFKEYLDVKIDKFSRAYSIVLASYNVVYVASRNHLATLSESGEIKSIESGKDLDLFGIRIGPDVSLGGGLIYFAEYYNLSAFALDTQSLVCQRLDIAPLSHQKVCHEQDV
jgi:hypothetical protein